MFFTLINKNTKKERKTQIGLTRIKKWNNQVTFPQRNWTQRPSNPAAALSDFAERRLRECGRRASRWTAQFDATATWVVDELWGEWMKGLIYSIYIYICIYVRWWFQIFVCFHLYLGKWSILTNMFQVGWFNHQLVKDRKMIRFQVSCNETEKAKSQSRGKNRSTTPLFLFESDSDL